MCACVLNISLFREGCQEPQGKRLPVHPSTWVTLQAERVYPSDGFPIAQTHIQEMRRAERFRHDGETTQTDLDVRNGTLLEQEKGMLFLKPLIAN